MNWQSVAFDWNQARAFLATAEEGSLSAAARALGLTQPTLGRQVAALEEALDVLLFERVGKTLVLTGTGRDLLAHFRAMGEAAQNISLAATGQSQAIEGQVTITTTDIAAAHVMPAIVERIQARAPRLVVEVLAVNTLADLQRREADIAVRHVQPSSPDLIARRLRDSTAHLYGARSYFERYGRPAHVADLTGHRFVGFGDIAQSLSFFGGLGISLSEENFRVGSRNGLVALEMVRQGLGLAMLPREIGAPLAGMEQVLPDLPPVPVPMWLTVHREVHTARRIRLVYDMLAEALTQRDVRRRVET